MSGFGNPIIGGAEKLIRAAIQSPNFVAGVSGWSINKDGTAEFNQLTIITSSAGAAILIYNGPATLGNLIGSWSAEETVDSFGNVVPAGLFATQGTFTGMQLINTLLTQCILDQAVMDSAQISNSAMTGGSITETTINFDNAGGQLFCYAVTQTTVTQTVGGNYTFTVPANVQSADVICKGAFPGGNGGGNGSGGDGGGGPECSREATYSLPVAGTDIDYTVGKGGDNSSTGGGDGNDGGDTFFDISNGGVIAHGGNADGTKGTGSVNNVHHDGGTGGNASGTGGAGCGGGAGTTGAGGNAPNNSGSGAGAGGAAGTGGGTAGGAGGANNANGSSPGGGAGAGSGTVSFDKTYTCTATHSYEGSDGTMANQKINDNGNAYQGGDRGNTYNGRAKTWIEFNNSQIQSDLAGVSLSSTTLRLNNNHSWYNSGMTAAIGWDTVTSFGGSRGDPGGAHIDSTRVHFNSGQSKFVAVSGLGSALKDGSALNVVLFHDSNSLTYYGYFAGKNQSSPPQVRVQGSTGGTQKSSGAGTDGSISIAYTSAATLLVSIAAVAGTDQYGNSYPAGIAINGLPLTYAEAHYASGNINVQRSGTTTPTDDPTIVVNVEANSVYEWQDTIIYSGGAAGATNFRWQWSLPSGAESYLATLYRPSTGGGTSNIVSFNINGAVSIAWTDGTTTEFALSESGTLYTGANAGQVKLQWALGTVSGGTTSRVWSGTRLTLRKVA